MPMTLQDFLSDADAEVRAIIAAEFKIEVVETTTVPSFDDPAITYDNRDTQVKRCKLLESCVLYVDIRNSSTISAERQSVTLARMYSTFVRMMIKCARHYGGRVRNIIGDRVMVVFDRQDCFVNAVRTAILCQTVAQKIIDRRITSFAFKCGVGIDFGKMLIVKAGASRRGAEMEFYRSHVWLGRPANVASKLTDIAAKPRVIKSGGYLRVGLYFR
ncbi:MAG: adenylate/guanylate cyclase domain-containing protein [Gemmatimonas sp.]